MRIITTLCLTSFLAFGCSRNSPPEWGDSQAPANPPPVATPSTENTKTAQNTEVIGPITTEINFNQVIWPQAMKEQDQQALELALNISGSFEGDESWATISNNSDGMGVSLGLLSQNLGSNTLQPLLAMMLDDHPAEMAQIFSKAHLAALTAMIRQWQTDSFGGGKGRSVLGEMAAQFDFIPPRTVPDNTPDTENTAAHNSVAWAVKNLYINGSFVPQWRAELQALAITGAYINLQFAQALSMHQRARAYIPTVGVDELRTYLLMFDFIDQDGLIYGQDFADYQNYLSTNPNLTSEAKLEEIMNLRLRHVSSRYVPDVLSRKQAIIHGAGFVHSENRNLESEYNFNRLVIYR